MPKRAKRGTPTEEASPSPEGKQAAQPTKMELINPFTAPTTYTNFAHSTMTGLEITIRFCEVLKAGQDGMFAREVSAVAMSPLFAKALAQLLGRSLAQYERAKGPLGEVDLSQIMEVSFSQGPVQTKVNRSSSNEP
jgi:hypothetical protein